MGTVLYTQRVEFIESYGERRDCSDQNISRFIQTCGYLPVPVPNMLEAPEELIAYVKPVGIVLTGGNSLVKYGGNAPERDRTDRLLIKAAIGRGIPIYGFCRGMQSVLDYFECRLENVEGHVAIRHSVQGIWGAGEVNSYHNQACRKVREPLYVAQMAGDGVIEAVECPQHKIMAVMWHPERENPFREEDIMRVRNLFGGKF